VSWNQPVFSSNVAEIGYDSSTNELLVTWKNGRVSAYEGVPEELAAQLANAPSVGGMLNSDIKNSYSHRYVR
jgi:KTSC domain